MADCILLMIWNLFSAVHVAGEEVGGLFRALVACTGSARHLKEAGGQAQSPRYLPGENSVVFSGLRGMVKGTSEVPSTVVRALVACTLEVPVT